MTRFILVVCMAIPLVLAGCATRGGVRPLASVRRVGDDVKAGVLDTAHETRRQVSKTWSDIWHDWNYADDERFAEVRRASGN